MGNSNNKMSTIGFSDDANDEGHKVPKAQRNIRTQPSDPTIKDLCDRIDKGRLNPQADFQRKYVWKDDTTLKSRLIESVFLDVPIPNIYTAEEDDGTEVVIDGQQRLQTFHGFLNNDFRLRGLTVCEELNHKNYRALGEIGDGSLQYKIDNYPLRIIKILKDSDSEVRFDIFERLNRGSVKLNDQELRNCIYRGDFNDFLKDVARDKDFQILLGSKEHKRMQDVEFALRFFAFHERTHLKYRHPMKHFLNGFMKHYQHADPTKLERYRAQFRKAVTAVRSLFGDHAFNLYSNKNNASGKYEKVVNKGLYDVLLYGCTLYEKHQLVPYKDSLKEELFWLMTNHDQFSDSITGTGTDNKKKVTTKVGIWLNSLEEILGTPQTEPRCFSWEIKNRLWGKHPVCGICRQAIESVDDAEMDHIEFYWKGGGTVPENARLAHRYCNRARRISREQDGIVFVKRGPEYHKVNDSLTNLEKSIRDKIHSILSQKKTDYWETDIPDNVKFKVTERIKDSVAKSPWEKDTYSLPDKKLAFCDIRDYLKIIKVNWPMFQSLFIGKSELEKHFHNLAEYRNRLRHGREINGVARKGGEAAMEWIANVIRK